MDGDPVRSRPVAIVILPARTIEPDKQLRVLMGYCVDEHLQPVAIVRGDPKEAVPLIIDRLIDAIVVPCQDRQGMTDFAELAAAAAGGELRYVRRKEGRPNRFERKLDPIVARMLDKGMSAELVAECLGVHVSEVYETICLSGRRLPAQRGTDRPVRLRGLPSSTRPRAVG